MSSDTESDALVIDEGAISHDPRIVRIEKYKTKREINAELVEQGLITAHSGVDFADVKADNIKFPEMHQRKVWSWTKGDIPIDQYFTEQPLNVGGATLLEEYANNGLLFSTLNHTFGATIYMGHPAGGHVLTINKPMVDLWTGCIPLSKFRANPLAQKRLERLYILRDAAPRYLHDRVYKMQLEYLGGHPETQRKRYQAFHCSSSATTLKLMTNEGTRNPEMMALLKRKLDKQS